MYLYFFRALMANFVITVWAVNAVSPKFSIRAFKTHASKCTILSLIVATLIILARPLADMDHLAFYVLLRYLLFLAITKIASSERLDGALIILTLNFVFGVGIELILVHALSFVLSGVAFNLTLSVAALIPAFVIPLYPIYSFFRSRVRWAELVVLVLMLLATFSIPLLFDGLEWWLAMGVASFCSLFALYKLRNKLSLFRKIQEATEVEVESVNDFLGS